MNEFSGIIAMRKRKRVSRCISRKKARDSQCQVVKAQNAERLTFAKELPNKRPVERAIAYHGDTETVALHPKQTVAMDGWAMVRVVKGRAAVHGYRLSPGVDFLLCSNSKHPAVLTIEAISPPKPADSFHSKSGSNHPAPCQSSRPSKRSGNGEDTNFGCILEFQSYGRATGDNEPSFDHESSRDRSFRLEIGVENEMCLEIVSRKRKRDEQMTSDMSEAVVEEEEMSSNAEIEEADLMNAGTKALEEVEMEVDEF